MDTIQVEVRTPAGAERLQLAYLAASAEERQAFLRWMQEYEAAHQRLQQYAKNWSPRPAVQWDYGQWNTGTSINWDLIREFMQAGWRS